MITLAQLGPLTVSANEEGLFIDGKAIEDLSSRASWPAGALDHTDGLRTALDVEQCLELGYAVPSYGRISIPYEFFPPIRRAGLGIVTRWSEWSPFLLKIDRISDIGRHDFRYRYSFLHEATPIAFQRIGYFGTLPGSDEIYRLDDQTYALVAEMERFNALPPEGKGRSESWLTFSKIKECAIDVGARLDSYLTANDVIVPRLLNLEVHTWPDGSVSFAPSVPGLEGAGLKRAFFHNPKAQDFYSVDRPAQSRVRIVFDERQTEVLERMKVVHRVRGENKERALHDPEAVFEGLLDVVEVRYGRRVTGIGALSISSPPALPRDRSVLEGGLPAETVGKETGESVSVKTTGGKNVAVEFQSSSNKQEFVSAARNALDCNESFFPFGDHLISVDQSVREFLNKEEKCAATIRENTGSVAADAFLIPYPDEEELKTWDVKDATEAQQPVQQSIGCILPDSLRSDVILKPHQLEGIAWLQTCHRLRPSRRGSLLADDMGLGKTLQILSYLAWCIEHDRELGLASETPPWRPILVVLPLILLENRIWEEEINLRFKNGIFDPVLVLHGDTIKELRRNTARGMETSLGRPLIAPEHFTRHRLVITNYQTLVNYQHSFAQLIPGTQRSLWSVLVTDEAQEYKSPSTKISHALKSVHPDVHIACTGTPVENRLLDLWNLIDTVQPALLGTSKDFSTKYERAADSADQLADLKRSLLFGHGNSFVLRRNKSDVLVDLPPKTYEPLYADLTDGEVRTHQELIASIGGGSPIKILHKLVALYQHPSLLAGEGGPLDAKHLLNESSKLRAVVDKLKQIRLRGEKVVIFAYRIPMQQILATVIEAEFHLQADIINGSTDRGSKPDAGSLGTQQARRTRTAILDRFRASRGFNVIILSPFVASIGLTITEANHVIHYGRWWNPALEAQATDRVYRIGQNKSVHIHLPILRDPKRRLAKSFDENLHELIEQKMERAREFLSPLPQEAQLAEELFERLKGNQPATDMAAPITSEIVDGLPHHLFEALVACLLEVEGYKTILTARSNDHGADALGFREGELWLIQAKHTKKDALIGSVAMADLMAASMSYRKPLAYSLHLLAITNGNFSEETRNEAERNGIQLLDRHKLMARLRTSPVSMGTLYLRENDRCTSFNDGIMAAKKWFDGA